MVWTDHVWVLSVQQLVGIWVVSTIRLLWILTATLFQIVPKASGPKPCPRQPLTFQALSSWLLPSPSLTQNPDPICTWVWPEWPCKQLRFNQSHNVGEGRRDPCFFSLLPFCSSLVQICLLFSFLSPFLPSFCINSKSPWSPSASGIWSGGCCSFLFCSLASNYVTVDRVNT